MIAMFCFPSKDFVILGIMVLRRKENVLKKETVVSGRFERQ